MRPSILCVESEEGAWHRLNEFLAEFECEFAGTADEALAQLDLRGFDAHVLDYWMPDWSGPLLCREIRKQDPHGPVILCRDASGDVRGSLLRSGATASLAKPLDEDALVAELRGLLRFAESESLRAASHAERAVHAELADRGVLASVTDSTAHALARLGAAASSVERTTRARAHVAFIDSGGTRAHFERWWADARHALFATPPAPGSPSQGTAPG